MYSARYDKAIIGTNFLLSSGTICIPDYHLKFVELAKSDDKLIFHYSFCKVVVLGKNLEVIYTLARECRLDFIQVGDEGDVRVTRISYEDA